MGEIEEAIEAEAQMAAGSWCDVLCPSALVRRMLLAGLGCAFFQQASGSEAIVYYTPTILEGFGVVSEEDKNLGAMAVGGSKFLGSCCGAFMLDLLGRRPAVVMSCVGTAVCLVGLAEFDVVSPVLGVALLCAYMLFFEVGVAPATYVLGTECYPVEIRAKALAVGMFTTRFLSGVVSVAFPSVVEAISLTPCLWIFAGVGLLGVVWAIVCVPETKGLTLEAAAQLFERPLCGGSDTEPSAPYESVENQEQTQKSGCLSCCVRG